MAPVSSQRHPPTFQPEPPGPAGGVVLTGDMDGVVAGQQIGDFVLLDLAGEGAYGTVWRARQVSLDRLVAIKILRVFLDFDAEAHVRFLREARIAAEIDHPGAAHVYGAGAERDGTLWLAMEWVPGTTLADVLAARGRLPVSSAAAFVVRFAEVVQAVHDAGIVHRDIKPANVMVQARGGRLEPRLIDLGIARHVTEAAVRAAATAPAGTLADRGSLLGTPRYMAPEQWSSPDAVGPAADQYALGALAWEAIAGRPPFDAPTVEAFARLHLGAPPPPLSECPAEVEAVLRRALAKEASERFPDVTAFAAALLAASEATNPPMADLTIATAAAALLRDRGPQPLAEAIARLEAASDPGRAFQALVDLERAALHLVGIYTLAALRQLPGSPEPERDVLRRTLDAHVLDPLTWARLATAIVRPWRERAGICPLPGLVHLASSAVWEQVIEDLAASARPDAPQVSGARLRERLAKLLEELAFLADWRLVIVRGTHAEPWMGAGRARRTIVQLADARLPDGTPAVLDADGGIALSLETLVVAGIAPASAYEALHLWAGTRRSASEYVCLPEGTLLHRPIDVAEVESQPSPACPWPGLQAYGPGDSGSFFGREDDVCRALNHLRADTLLVVVGPSGVGKSSFVLAGVLPLLGDQVVVVRPGARPFEALRAAAIPPGGVLVVDQFEECFTLGATPQEVEATGFAVLALANAGTRVILTLREDFLTRAHALSAFRERLPRALCLLAPLDRDALLRVLVAPLAQIGWRFEDAALPARLVDEVNDSLIPLPLLSFAGSRMWELRDPVLRHIPARAAAAVGGVTGALAQHADETLERMTAGERDDVREAFRRLLTAAGTRDRIRWRDLSAVVSSTVGIERLISARILVASEGEDGEDRVEIAHEALVLAWPRLAGWRRADAEGVRLRDQLTEAARQWEERGRSPALLWRDDVLAEYRGWRRGHTSGLTPSEADFAEASLAREARSKRIRAILIGAALVGLSLALLVTATFAQKADAARAVAQENAGRVEAALTATQVERGRQLLLDGHPGEALVWLAEAARRGADGSVSGFLLAEAARRMDAQVAAWQAEDGPVSELEWSSDGQRLATVGPSGEVTVWELPAGRRAATIPSTGSPVEKVAFSPDGEWIVTRGADRQLRVFSAQTGAASGVVVEGASDGFVLGGDRVLTFRTNLGARLTRLADGGDVASLELPVTKARLSGDGKTAAFVLADGRIAVWLPDQARTVFVRPRAGAWIGAFRLSPDGSIMAAGGIDGRLSTWALPSGEPLARHDFGHDIRLGLVGSDRLWTTGTPAEGAELWDSRAGTRILRLPGSIGTVLDGPPTSDPDALRLWSEGALTVWSGAGDIRAQLGLPPAGHGAPRPSPHDATVALSERSGVVRVLDPARVEYRAQRLPAACGGAHLSPDGTLRLCVDGALLGSFRVHAAQSGALVGEVRAESAAAAEVSPVWTPDGTALLLPGWAPNVAAAWKVGDASPTVLDGHTGAITAVAASPTHLATASADGTVRLRSLDGRTLAVVDVSDERVTALGFDHAGRTLVGGGQRGSVRRWDVATGARLAAWPAHSERVLTVSFSANDLQVLSGGNEGSAILQDAANGRRLASFTGHGSPVYGALFAPGERVVTTAVNTPARVWDATTGQELARFGAAPAQPWMAPDSAEIVFHDSGRALRFDLSDVWPYAGDVQAWVACRVSQKVEGAVLVEVAHPQGCR